MVEALRARKTAVQSISAASNGGRDSQGAADAYVSRRRAIRRRHSAVNQGRGGRVVARHIYLIKLPHLLDLEQRILDFPNCDNYGSLTASNPDPMLDNTPTNDNKLHQVICNTFKIDYFQEMDTIVKLRNRLECKINFTLLALLPNKLNTMRQGPVTSGENIRNKRAIPTLAIIQGIAAMGGMMIKGINTLDDAKRASFFNNAIKLVNENVQITHD